MLMFTFPIEARTAKCGDSHAQERASWWRCYAARCNRSATALNLDPTRMWLSRAPSMSLIVPTRSAPARSTVGCEMGATGCDEFPRFDRTNLSLADLAARAIAEATAAKITNLADARARLRPTATIAVER
jgi:hypothetical protein